VEVKVEHGRAPLVCGVLAGEHRHYRGNGNRFEEFTTVHHTLLQAKQSEV
jgi:hypothetical protein